MRRKPRGRSRTWCSPRSGLPTGRRRTSSSRRWARSRRRSPSAACRACRPALTCLPDWTCPVGWASRTSGRVPRATRSADMYEGVIQNLIDELGRLPGVGPKGAQRIAFYLLATDHTDVKRLADALIEMTERVKFCRTCGNVAEADEWRICSEVRGDPTVICVVEEPKDVAAVEKIREYRGRYHVLGGAISPIDGVGPDELRIRELMTRLADGTVTELILATDPNLEGEATAAYIARLVKPMGLRVTRPASGLPVGGDLEYADEVTLGRAFEGRRLVDA